jgi:hypothetical protein
MTDQENDSDVDISGRPKCFTSTFQEVLFVLTATMAIGQQSFFQGCIVGVTASIGKDLHMNAAEITWINAGASYVQFLLFISLHVFPGFYPIPCIHHTYRATYTTNYDPTASQVVPSYSHSGS